MNISKNIIQNIVLEYLLKTLAWKITLNQYHYMPYFVLKMKTKKIFIFIDKLSIINNQKKDKHVR